MLKYSVPTKLLPEKDSPTILAERAIEMASATNGSLFLGVDVGTGSARAGIFNEQGKLVSSASSSLQIWKEGDCIEQSSTDIWHAVCAATKTACNLANVTGKDISSVGFAATCSLVAVDADDSPVTVSWSGDSRRNIIVWMDHRAVDQAQFINALHSPVLQYAGGALSPEMQPPKLLWVKQNLWESWAMAFRWMDLSDWLTYRATGDDTRSLCTTVCKWTYLGHAHMRQMSSKDSEAMEACGWDDDFWEEIGLGDLVQGRYAKIGKSVAFPGHPLGAGLTRTAAKELGLLEGTPVGASLIDAHAGGIGVIESVPPSNVKFKDVADSLAENASSPNARDSEFSKSSLVASEEEERESLCHRMVLVCGTSTCHMAVSQSKVFIPGVWGPFWSAMIPELWLTEGGQSATGALLDYMVANHVAAPHLANRAAAQNVSLYGLLNKTLETMAYDIQAPFVASLTKDLHVLADFHGNRKDTLTKPNQGDSAACELLLFVAYCGWSPLADPKAKGMICGLTLDTGEKQLAILYLATVQSIAYGTRHIVEHCNSHGLKIDTLFACGGLSKNSLYVQEHADIIGCPVILPRENESVLLGAAILGAVAAKKFASLYDAMKALNAPGQVIQPSKDPRVKGYHDAKYRIFRDLYQQQCSYREIMSSALS